jgi:tRNA 5-methylaminomethyl-2-thiouridine biosynthesis bifunctional protein
MKTVPFRIQPARATFKDGALYSADYADVYHSVGGAIAEARHVFLGGNALPQRWQGVGSFTIVETGFGCGLNFLATWDALKCSGAACRLDFVSVEKHPFTAADLTGILRAWPQLDTLSRELLHAYPPLVPGFHRLHFDEGRISLTLLLGEAVEMLSELDACADAFFLDGFAPSRNADMWSKKCFAQLARIAAPGATAATYSSAALVRKGLEQAGFSVQKKPGFARKRDMLTASMLGRKQSAADSRKAIVIGAGIAGTSCAFALARRGIEVELIDCRSEPGGGSSSNPAAVVRPFVTLDAGVRNRFGWAAFLHAVRLYRDLKRQTGLTWRETGVLQLARNAAHWDKLVRALGTLEYPAGLVSVVDAERATLLCGAPVTEDALWFPSGGFIEGQSLCAALADSMSRLIRFRGAVELHSISSEGGFIRAVDLENRTIASGDLAVLANGIGLQSLAADGAPWLRPARGQVTGITAVAAALRMPVCRDGYVTPPLRGYHYVGGTFDESRAEALVLQDDHEANLRRAARIMPEVFDSVKLVAGSGWAGVRCVSRDRLPVVGELAERLCCCVAMGSRGFSWAPLAGETLASLATAAPAPLARTVLNGGLTQNRW